MSRPFLLGVVAALVAEAVLAALVIWSGVVPVAATSAGGLPDRVLGYASTRSIARHARDEKNPLAGDRAALKSGLELYRAMCVTCHGGPGAEPQEFASGLHPAAPDLASREVQAFTDGMLYEAIAKGIGSTGMPAFGPTHRPEQLWAIVAFLRHLPALSPAEKAQLGRGGGGDHHGGEASAEGGAHGEPGEHAASHAGGGGAPSREGGGQRVHKVSISSFKFVPPTLEVNVGDVVEWRNDDFAAHTATADDRSFDTGRIDGGQAKRVVAKKSGQFPYFCTYHAAMKGTLTVK
jgi:plastocyanin/mono/diheme cytochrome c family protein